MRRRILSENEVNAAFIVIPSSLGLTEEQFQDLQHALGVLGPERREEIIRALLAHNGTRL